MLYLPPFTIHFDLHSGLHYNLFTSFSSSITRSFFFTLCITFHTTYYCSPISSHELQVPPWMPLDSSPRLLPTRTDKTAGPCPPPLQTLKGLANIFCATRKDFTIVYRASSLDYMTIPTALRPSMKPMIFSPPPNYSQAACIYARQSQSYSCRAP
jgi:hypothetical protein